MPRSPSPVLALSFALSSCGQAPPTAASQPLAPPARAAAAPTASQSSAPAAPAVSSAASAPPPGVPGFPGALARFGSLTHRVPNALTRVYAFDSGDVWLVDGRHIRDVATDELVVTVEGCAAFDLLPSGDRLVCLKRNPIRLEIMQISSGQIESTLSLGVQPKPARKGPRASILADLSEQVGVTRTESNGLRVIVAGKQVTVSPPPYKVNKVEDAPSPFAGAFSEGGAKLPEDPPADTRVSPNGSVRAIVDKDTLGVVIETSGKREGPGGWAPSSSPIGAAWLSDGGFVIWYGSSWERVDRDGRLAGRAARGKARHHMVGAFVNEGRDGAFVGTDEKGDGYRYRLMTPDLAAPTFHTDRCLAQVPGTTSVVCSDIRVPATDKDDAEGDVVLFDAITGQEQTRRSLGKTHLTSAFVAADGAILIEPSSGKRQIWKRDLAVAVPDLDVTIKKAGKLGFVVGLLPGNAVLFHATRDPGLWVIEGDAFRPLFVEAAAELSAVEPSPDGKRVAVVVHRGHDTELLLLDAATGKAEAKFVGPMGRYVGALAFDAKGERLLTAAQGVVWVWDATGRGSL